MTNPLNPYDNQGHLQLPADIYQVIAGFMDVPNQMNLAAVSRAANTGARRQEPGRAAVRLQQEFPNHFQVLELDAAHIFRREVIAYLTSLAGQPVLEALRDLDALPANWAVSLQHNLRITMAEATVDEAIQAVGAQQPPNQQVLRFLRRLRRRIRAL